MKVVSVTGTYENQRRRGAQIFDLIVRVFSLCEKIEIPLGFQPYRVVISKADATTGVELDGAKLTLLDASGKEIDSWTSVAARLESRKGFQFFGKAEKRGRSNRRFERRASPPT